MADEIIRLSIIFLAGLWLGRTRYREGFKEGYARAGFSTFLKGYKKGLEEGKARNE